MVKYKSPHIPMHDVARVYDALEIGLIITTSDGTIIWGNKYYSHLAQFDIRRYFGHNVREIFLNEDIILPNDNYIIDEVIRTKQQQTKIVRYRTKDHTLTTAIPIFNDNADIDYIIYTITNYSELMRLQDKISESSMRVTALENHLRNIQVDSSLDTNIIISDKNMYNLYGKALRLATTAASVMLTGETGTGKDVLARFIHQNSPRKEHNFIHVNLSTIPKSLFESELFGYTEGSFTGASKSGKDGLIQLADKGTLFLDEIGELPVDIQAKLLQVIQDKEVRSIGAIEPTPVDFRIICATNRNLQDMVDNREFRRDLFYRLNACELVLPPLRERPDDLAPLAAFFLNRYNAQNHSHKYFTNEILPLFHSYSWSGNVRELQHLIESLVVLAPTDAITTDQLPGEFQVLLHELAPISDQAQKKQTLKKSVEELEKYLIRTALSKYRSAAQAAEALGIDASTLSKKRKRYGL